ncbi:hypothetical protein AQJ30_03975 [Streptomyces longwoodensis]|uniref:Uncharacterized protein n=1 Tax=Streptomyces longwoodensis TaxID=68231 RepID=A0A117QQD4_9ACTN|nr:hypothetical protein AQJ30_03975 [Streptomyces longwoodensis]
MDMAELLERVFPGHGDRWARRPLPAHGGPVEGHGVGVGAELHEELEGRFPVGGALAARDAVARI